MFGKLKSGHMKIAIIIAPLLAIGGWGLAETIWNAKYPHLATSKRPYSLCDLAANECVLIKRDLQLRFVGVYDDGRALSGLKLSSNKVLQRVLVGVVRVKTDAPPLSMHSADGLVWELGAGVLSVPDRDPGNLILRIVARADKHEYLGEMKLNY